MFSILQPVSGKKGTESEIGAECAVNSIRILFKVIGAVFVIGMIAIGIGGTYLERNPEEAAAYAVATMGVDRDAGMLDQAGQMIDNYGDARRAIADAEIAESEYRVRQAQRAVTAEGWSEESATGHDWSDQASASSDHFMD